MRANSSFVDIKPECYVSEGLDILSGGEIIKVLNSDNFGPQGRSCNAINTHHSGIPE